MSTTEASRKFVRNLATKFVRKFVRIGRKMSRVVAEKLLQEGSQNRDSETVRMSGLQMPDREPRRSPGSSERREALQVVGRLRAVVVSLSHVSFALSQALGLMAHT